MTKKLIFLKMVAAPNKSMNTRVAVYVKGVPLYSTVVKWEADLKHGCESLEDNPRSGWPADVTDPQTVSQVKGLIMEDRWMEDFSMLHGTFGQVQGLSKMSSLKSEHTLIDNNG